MRPTRYQVDFFSTTEVAQRDGPRLRRRAPRPNMPLPIGAPRLREGTGLRRASRAGGTAAQASQPRTSWSLRCSRPPPTKPRWLGSHTSGRTCGGRLAPDSWGSRTPCPRPTAPPDSEGVQTPMVATLDRRQRWSPGFRCRHVRCAEGASNTEVGSGDPIGMTGWPLHQLNPVTIGIGEPGSTGAVRAGGAFGVAGCEARLR
jgi:hypothetical protein